VLRLSDCYHVKINKDVKTSAHYEIVGNVLIMELNYETFHNAKS
jgi:hypothetical protein